MAGPDDVIDAAELALLAEAFRKTMSSASGQVLDIALSALGWRDLLAEMPGTAIPMVFRLLGETGAHAPLLNDVLLTAAGREAGGTLPLPYAGSAWVIWDRTDQPSVTIDGEIPLRRLPAAHPADAAAGPASYASPANSASPASAGGTAAADAGAPDGALAAGAAALAAGRRAVGWWLLGSGRAMLALARAHAVDRMQFGRPIASFQAVRHRLADTLVALDGAEAVLTAAGEQAADEQVAEPGHGAGDVALASLLAKAAAGQAALTAARHCQQVLGGIGFTAEHALHIHVKRVLVLDGLLGSTRELTREAGRRLIATGAAPRLVDL